MPSIGHVGLSENPYAKPPHRCATAASGSRLLRCNRWLRRLLLWAGASAALFVATPVAICAPLPWVGRLQAALERIDARNHADIGVFVLDLSTGASASHRIQESWYLASTVKVPVAIEVLRGVERGDFTLDTVLTLRRSDYIDGSGQTNSHAVGSPLTVRYLIDQMIVYSDNTASDMLIGLVGIQNVNAMVQSLVPHGFQAITSLADVRRHVYSQLDPAAMRLSGKDFLVLKQQRSDADRRQALAALLRTPINAFRMPTVVDAYDAYYASGLNSARLDAYGELLKLLVNGQVLSPAGTSYLLEVMGRTKTGAHRIRAGLPASVHFAHKTGTQSARTCDSGVITVPDAPQDRKIVVAACTRGEMQIANSDRVLREVGTAICESGLLLNETFHESSCPVEPRALLSDRSAAER